MAFAAVTLLAPVATDAAVIRPNTFESGADAPLANDSLIAGTTASGATGQNMEIRAGDTATSRNRLGIIRFDLSEITGDLTGTTISFFETGNNSRTVTVFGLVDGDTGENWDEATITYDTAPAISLNPGPPPSTTFDALRTVNLGTFNTTASTGEVLSFGGAALETFLASDTNDLVTFYFYRDGGGAVTIRTKENTNTTQPPTLTLPNATLVPEPGAMCLLAFGGLALLSRRR
jgi:hypothetical protein